MTRARLAAHGVLPVRDRHAAHPQALRPIRPIPGRLELATVFLLTGTTLILEMAGRLLGETLGTLLGGISGYVLGRAAQVRTAESSKGAYRVDSGGDGG